MCKERGINLRTLNIDIKNFPGKMSIIANQMMVIKEIKVHMYIPFSTKVLLVVHCTMYKYGSRKGSPVVKENNDTFHHN